MPHYRYAARDERGNAVTGTLDAMSQEALADELKRMGYCVTKAREAAGSPAALEAWLSRLRRVSSEERALCNVQLAKLVRVGIPLVNALDTLAQQLTSPTLRTAIRDIAKQVEAGTGFSEALERYPRLFSKMFVSMVRAGEVSGKLDEILIRLADTAKREAEQHQQLRAALTYPAILLIAGIGVTAFLLVGIIPKFMKIFLEAGARLPGPTLALHTASQLFQRWWPLLLGLAVGAGVGFSRYAATVGGRRRLDQLLTRVPVIGELVRTMAVARMARTLATLLSSGVPVLESLDMAERTCGNAVIAECVHQAQSSVRQGRTIAEPFKRAPDMPPMVSSMVSVGESSGTLEYMLGEIAQHYDEMVQYRLKRLMTLIEPCCLVVMGGLVAFIMAAMLLPLFDMASAIRR